VLVTEARERVGGNITSVSGDGYIWEEGPNSCQPSDAFLKMAVRPSHLDNMPPRRSEGFTWHCCFALECC
jgi:oxygen-dependent protoporphyrinogen oxidase